MICYSITVSIIFLDESCPRQASTRFQQQIPSCGRGDAISIPPEASAPRKSALSMSKPTTERKLHIKAVGKGEFAAGKKSQNSEN